MTENAAVLCPEPDNAAPGIEYCECCGYHLYSIIPDWPSAMDLLQADLVQVIVVARREIWTPRIEYAERRNQRTTISTAGTANTRWRRARVVRRYR